MCCQYKIMQKNVIYLSVSVPCSYACVNRTEISLIRLKAWGFVCKGAYGMLCKARGLKKVLRLVSKKSYHSLFSKMSEYNRKCWINKRYSSSADACFLFGVSLSLEKRYFYTFNCILYCVFTNVYVKKGISNYYVLVTLCSTQYHNFSWEGFVHLLGACNLRMLQKKLDCHRQRSIYWCFCLDFLACLLVDSV